MRRLSLVAVTGLVAAGLTLSACGSDSLSTSPGAGSAPAGTAAGGGVDQALAAKVPAKIKSAGKIVVGTDPTYAPNEMLATDGKTVEGFDVDIFNAVAAKLGLKTECPAPASARSSSASRAASTTSASRASPSTPSARSRSTW